MAELATDRGAGNIIWWTIVLAVIGSAIPWSGRTPHVRHEPKDPVLTLDVTEPARWHDKAELECQQCCWNAMVVSVPSTRVAASRGRL
jgi:hypothetical protein